MNGFKFGAKPTGSAAAPDVVTISADGRWLATAAGGDTLRLLDVANERSVQPFVQGWRCSLLGVGARKQQPAAAAAATARPHRSRSRRRSRRSSGSSSSS